MHQGALELQIGNLSLLSMAQLPTVPHTGASWGLADGQGAKRLGNILINTNHDLA